MKKIFNSPLFWINATVIAGLSYYFSFYFFPKTFPLINVSITMDREQALEQAHSIAQENHIGPEDYQKACSFYTDAETQTFIELEAGGKNAFVAMMENNLYMPYTWLVRHFKEFEKNEVFIRFTPDGRPYGFVETISEDLPGAQLSEHEAEKIAQEHAQTTWNVNFEQYKRVEASQKEQPSKRLDHTFVYERTDATIGEGFYRLKIQVSGDKVTELKHFVKIPETFTRRYAHMRSANTSIAWAATLFMGLLYILGGCGLGLYCMFRKRWEIWKQPLKWALLLALCQALALLNQLPSLWMYYNSAYATQNYLIQLLLSSFSGFLFQTAAYTLIIIAAESLTRRAFGNHPQLWSLWISRHAASYSVLARTYGAYLLVGVMSAFVVTFYFFATRYFNWWIPSSILFDPNILATYVPWFTPIAASLNAGFIEECLFRAIPLASAALLGKYLNRRRLWISIGFIVQILIFSAAHANYATQPAYARLIELIFPSSVFGIIYLRFGLLPGIITHVIYDLLWFSIPLFVSTSPDALLYKIIIIVMGLLPLLLVFYARIRQGMWHHFDEEYRNRAWQPLPVAEQQETSVTHSEQHVPTKTKKFIFCISVIALLVLIWATPLKHDGITITKTKSEIIADADAVLRNRAIELPAPYKRLPLFFYHYSQLPQLSLQHRFVWREGKKDLYNKLLNTYLQPAHWTIRYAQFEGDLIERAEEYSVMFYDSVRSYHKIPESRAGAYLTKQEARDSAHRHLKERFSLQPTDVVEMSAVETQLPNRKNWLFTFIDPTFSLDTGQARITILISGDEIVDSARIIHVPEAWERTELHNLQQVGIIKLIFSLLFALLILIALAYAHKQHLSYAVSMRLCIVFFVTFITLSLVQLLNTYPSVIGAFNTSAPWNNQFFQHFGSAFFIILCKALALALAMAYSIGHIRAHKTKNSRADLFVGYGIGIIIAALSAFAHKIMPSLHPVWPDYSPLSTAFPLIGAVTQRIMNYVTSTVGYSMLFIIINHATAYWHKNRMLFGLLLVMCGFIIPLESMSALPLWCGTGTVIGMVMLVFYVTVVRHNTTIVPLIVASLFIVNIVQQGLFNAYPDAWLAALVSAVVIMSMSVMWFKKLNR